MTLQELLEQLDVGDGESICYFEQFADLIEMDEEIPYDLFYMVVSAMYSEDAQDLVENYFEDLTSAAPDYDDELISLIETIKQGLILAAADLEDDDAKRSFAEQLYNFREWFNGDANALIDGKASSVKEAIACNRAEKLGDEPHKYEFPSCADYDLDSIGISLGKFEKVDILGEDADDAE